MRVIFFSLLSIVTFCSAAFAGQNDLWIRADRSYLRTCPDLNCGLTGWMMFREKVSIFEKKNGWGRIEEYHPGMCINGISDYVDEGNKSCTIENGFIDGKVARWVPMNDLTDIRPPDPAEGATGFYAIVAASDDYHIHKDTFAKAAEKLTKKTKCSEDELSWMKSVTKYPNQPVYFIDCWQGSRPTRYYLNAATGKIFEK